MWDRFRCLFFFQAEDGIRDGHVTGVQTCALPILWRSRSLFKKSIRPPAGTMTTRGANEQSFWSMVVVDGRASPADPAGALSSQTTALRILPCGETRRSSELFSLPQTY